MAAKALLLFPLLSSSFLGTAYAYRHTVQALQALAEDSEGHIHKLHTQAEEDAREVGHKLQPCLSVSREARAKAHGGGPDWRGLYRCLKSDWRTVAEIICDFDPAKLFEPACWLVNGENDCSRTSFSVRSMALAGMPGWQGAYKCAHKGEIVVITCDELAEADVQQEISKELQNFLIGRPMCWVKSKPDDIEKVWEGIVSGLAGAVNFVKDLFIPDAPSDAALDSAIETFVAKAGDDAPPEDEIAELKSSWAFMTPFEKKVTVLALSSDWDGAGSLLQESDAEDENSSPESFWVQLWRLILALFQSSHNRRKRAAANHYMSMNVGWDHVRRNMRADGWRW